MQWSVVQLDIALILNQKVLGLNITDASDQALGHTLITRLLVTSTVTNTG